MVVMLVNVPHVAPEQPAPESDQLTPLLAESLVSVAVKFWVPMPACTLAEPGASEMEMAGAAVTVMVAASDLVPSAMEVAVTVTVAGFGTVAGAV